MRAPPISLPGRGHGCSCQLGELALASTASASSAAGELRASCSCELGRASIASTGRRVTAPRSGSGSGSGAGSSGTSSQSSGRRVGDDLDDPPPIVFMPALDLGAQPGAETLLGRRARSRTAPRARLASSGPETKPHLTIVSPSLLARLLLRSRAPARARRRQQALLDEQSPEGTPRDVGRFHRAHYRQRCLPGQARARNASIGVGPRLSASSSEFAARPPARISDSAPSGRARALASSA